MKNFILFAVLASFICGCTGNTNKKEDDKKQNSFADHYELSDNVYIDRSGCLHVNKDCLELSSVGEDQKDNYQVKFVETKNLTPSNFNAMCSQCVSDESYQKIKKIIKRNCYDENGEIYVDTIVGE